MTTSINVALLVGSLGKASINQMVAKVLIECAPPVLKFTHVEIDGLNLYNSDEDAEPPTSWTTFRNTVKVCDALLFVTPEYNRSVPGGLTNALDVGSCPYGHAVCGVASPQLW